MARTTPGFDFLRRNLQVPVVSACFICALFRWLEHQSPTWAPAYLALPVIVLHILVRKLLKEYAEAAHAARMDAQPVGTAIRSGALSILSSQRFDHRGGKVRPLVVEYGPMMFGINTVVTTSLEHMKIVLSTDPDSYVKDESLYEAMGLVASGRGYSTRLVYDMWKFHRTITRPFFKRNRTFHLQLFTRHAQLVVSEIISGMKDHQSVDFAQNLVRHSTLNIATDLLFGTCVSCLSYPVVANPNASPPFHPVTEFSEALLDLQEVVSERERLGWVWPLYELYGDKAKAPVKVIGRHLAPIVQWALGRKMMRSAGVAYHTPHSHNIEDEYGKESLLDHLVELTSEPHLVQSAILNTLIAGRAGTAITLNHITSFLARYPAIFHRLRQEILEVVGPTKVPDGEDMSTLKYLRAVINETLRLMPQTQYMARESVTATTWPSPNPTDKRIYIPPRAKISLDISVLHTSKDLWGPDADLFDPDRFLDWRYDKYVAPRSYIFLPFSSGPRACVGKDFPYDEISITVIELLRRATGIKLSAAGTSFSFESSRFPMDLS
ncbi:putative cytochrome P450 monooxygenase [Lyophyllum shimeji]|uniref:Cytochrome P450 monooxygenase n=1 Tax=Lyophyllum shimeji TaxID=47721 RepID=A0A9P3PWL1_LYOSH|nr:putative cytochrome P450 monooxygenase [Lyophyllum shimeji]